MVTARMSAARQAPPPVREVAQAPRTGKPRRLYDSLRDQGLRVDEGGENPVDYGSDDQLEAALTSCEEFIESHRFSMEGCGPQPWLPHGQRKRRRTGPQPTLG